MVTKRGRMLTYFGGLLPISHMTLWSRGLGGSRNKLKLLYLHKHRAHGHQTWKDGNIPERAPNHKVI